MGIRSPGDLTKSCLQSLKLLFQYNFKPICLDSCKIGIPDLVNGSFLAGLVGLAISYTLSISALLQSLVTTFTDTEKNMVSMERAQQYTVDVPWEQQEGIRKVKCK